MLRAFPRSCDGCVGIAQVNIARTGWQHGCQYPSACCVAMHNDADLYQWAAEHHGLITRAQAFAAGHTDASINTLLAARVWIRVHDSVYRVAACPTSNEQSL